VARSSAARAEARRHTWGNVYRERPGRAARRVSHCALPPSFDLLRTVTSLNYPVTSCGRVRSRESCTVSPRFAVWGRGSNNGRLREFPRQPLDRRAPTRVEKVKTHFQTDRGSVSYARGVRRRCRVSRASAARRSASVGRVRVRRRRLLPGSGMGALAAKKQHVIAARGARYA